jgi:hypothetical protein
LLQTAFAFGRPHIAAGRARWSAELVLLLSYYPDRRFVRGKGGVLLLNVFSIRYFEPGTQKVANPDVGPSVVVPVVVTAPTSGRVSGRQSETSPEVGFEPAIFSSGPVV